MGGGGGGGGWGRLEVMGVTGLGGGDGVRWVSYGCVCEGLCEGLFV